MSGGFFGGIGRALDAVFRPLQDEMPDGQNADSFTAQTPFVAYYGKVGLELSKLVFHGQKMSPP